LPSLLLRNSCLPRRIIPAAGSGSRAAIAADGLPVDRFHAIVLCDGAGANSQGTFLPAVALAEQATGLLGKHPAGNSLLEGGRSLLREYAQKATLTSLATMAFPRQCNGLGRRQLEADCNWIFTLEEWIAMGLRAEARGRAIWRGVPQSGNGKRAGAGVQPLQRDPRTNQPGFHPAWVG